MSEIYNIIDKKKLDVVNNSIEKAHGLPNECYTSKDYTLIERKKLFEDKWIVAGVASSIPEIGDKTNRYSWNANFNFKKQTE